MPTPRRGRPRNEAARAKIIDAGSELFSRDGYARTTMGDIAARAGVAVQTIYSAFGSKLGVLAAAHDVAVVSDDAPVPLLDREWFGCLLAAKSIEAASTVAVTHVTASTERVAPIYGVIQSASADPDVAALLADLRHQRHQFSHSLARQLIKVPGAGSDGTRLADTLYATLCVETYALYVTECGWPVERWREWARDVVTRELGAIP